MIPKLAPNLIKETRKPRASGDDPSVTDQAGTFFS